MERTLSISGFCKTYKLIVFLFKKVFNCAVCQLVSTDGDYDVLKQRQVIRSLIISLKLLLLANAYVDL